MNQHVFSKSSHVVAIGGGHGLGRLLSAFDFLEHRLTGIVATTDNGGSTGRLREETGCIAWGDLRNCLSQLTREKDLKSLLFDYRFKDDTGSLKGHSLGNMMLLALDDMCVRPMDTLTLFRDFFNIKSRIIPMAEMPAHLVACCANGDNVHGEVGIDALESVPQRIKIVPGVSATKEAINEINRADLILMGPGSFITSVMPPLLVTEIAAAIHKSHAPKILIGNMVAEDGPSGKIPLKEKLQWMEMQIGYNIVDAIIWPESREIIGDSPSNLILSDLFFEGHERLHDRNKLVNTVSQVYSQLSKKKVIHPLRAG